MKSLGIITKHGKIIDGEYNDFWLEICIMRKRWINFSKHIQIVVQRSWSDSFNETNMCLFPIFLSNIFTSILFLDQWKVIYIAVILEKHLNMQIKSGIEKEVHVSFIFRQ